MLFLNMKSKMCPMPSDTLTIRSLGVQKETDDFKGVKVSVKEKNSCCLLSCASKNIHSRNIEKWLINRGKKNIYTIWSFSSRKFKTIKSIKIVRIIFIRRDFFILNIISNYIQISMYWLLDCLTRYQFSVKKTFTPFQPQLCLNILRIDS